jgi:hypothetical protein
MDGVEMFYCMYVYLLASNVTRVLAYSSVHLWLKLLKDRTLASWLTVHGLLVDNTYS